MIININKSYILAALGYLLSLIGVLALLLSALPVALKFLVSPVLMLATHLQVRRVALLTATDSVVALGLGESREDGDIELYLGADCRLPVPCQITRSLVIKNLVTAQLATKTGNQPRNLFLARPMCSREEFRILKRYLLSLEAPQTA